MSLTIRAKIDRELTNRVGKWFTVRQIQDKLRVNPSTLKPLIMKYARENVLKRRKVKGTARSVQFTPAAPSKNVFATVLNRHMPYRNLTTTAKKTTLSAKRAAPKSARRNRR
jgi:DNA-binding MarR family transcriptional regulator